MSDKINVPVWCKIGKMLVRGESLPSDHQESEYNYIKSVLGLKPEDFGVHHVPQSAASGSCDKVFDLGWAASGFKYEKSKRGRK